jgi:hypothetical protein
MLTIPKAISQAIGLRDEDAQLVHDLVHVWQVKRPRNLLRHDYYTMHNKLKDLGISIPPSLRSLDAACGWGKKTVDVMVEHSKFDGWTVDDPEAQLMLDEVMRREKMRTKYRKATTSALEQCYCLYFVSEDDGKARVSAYPASASSAIYDDAKGDISSAMFVVAMQRKEGLPTDTPSWLNVVTDSYLIRIQWDGNDWRATYEQHGLGHLPAFVAPYEATLERPMGTSRITREVMGYIDEAVRSNINESIASAFAASTQKYLLGTDADTFEGIDRWQAYIGNIINVDMTSEATTPTFGQLAQPSMQPLTDHFRNLCGRMAAATGIHVSQFGQVHDNPASSEAIYAENEPLILKVKDWNETAGETLRDVAIACYATEMGMTFDEAAALNLGIDPRFRNPALPTLAQQTDAAVKLASVVDGFSLTDTFWELNGFNSEERKRIKNELREAQGMALLGSIMSE